MATDIDNAVKNNDELTLNLKRVKEMITDVGKERVQFIMQQDKIRG